MQRVWDQKKSIKSFFAHDLETPYIFYLLYSAFYLWALFDFFDFLSNLYIMYTPEVFLIHVAVMVTYEFVQYMFD